MLYILCYISTIKWSKKKEHVFLSQISKQFFNVFTEKNLHICGPVQLNPVLFQGQLCYFSHWPWYVVICGHPNPPGSLDRNPSSLSLGCRQTPQLFSYHTAPSCLVSVPTSHKMQGLVECGQNWRKSDGLTTTNMVSQPHLVPTICFTNPVRPLSSLFLNSSVFSLPQGIYSHTPPCPGHFPPFPPQRDSSKVQHVS